MQHHNPAPLEVEHLMNELAMCVNDLQRLRTSLSLADVNHAAISLSKLEALIASVKNRRHFLKLAG